LHLPLEIQAISLSHLLDPCITRQNLTKGNVTPLDCKYQGCADELNANISMNSKVTPENLSQ
jgi:hypothetical protein